MEEMMAPAQKSDRDKLPVASSETVLIRSVRRQGDAPI